MVAWLMELGPESVLAPGGQQSTLCLPLFDAPVRTRP